MTQTNTIFAFRNRLALGVALATLAVGSGANAQQATNADAGVSAAGDDAIVVTAQRRKERVVDVPISITVADQAQLERQQVNTFNDLNRIAPSLEIQQAPGQNVGGGASIRGIGTQTFSAGAVAAVGVVVDQVSQGNVNISDLFDISRVEVLKGPQGTLFGLTTSAGVINITTNAPDPNRFSARVRTELSAADFAGSRFGNQVIQGMINLPVSQDSALRISAVGNLRQGPDKNTLDNKYANVDHYSVRGRFLWNASDRLKINLIGDYTFGRTTNEGDFFSTLAPEGVDQGCGITAGPGNANFCMANTIIQHDFNYGASLEVDYDLGGATLTSITAYRKSLMKNNGQNISRNDTNPLQISAGPQRIKNDLITQEIRIGSNGTRKLDYTIGAFASHAKTQTSPYVFDVSLTLFPGFTIPFVHSLGSLNDVNSSSLAAFGELTYHIDSRLRAIAGGRITQSKLKLDRLDLDGPVASTQRLDVTRASFRLGLQYDIAPNTMAYFTASRGHKDGQIAIPTLPLTPYVILPETPMAYEAGIKTILLKSWTMDFNVYSENVKNFQAQSCGINTVTHGLECFNTNISSVLSRGFELNFFGKPTKNLTINTGLIYSDATYPAGYLGNDGIDLSHQQIASSPKFKFTFSGEYNIRLSDSWHAFVGADAVYKTKVRLAADSIASDFYRAHWIVGGRLGISDDEGKYTAAVFARNLTNNHEPIFLLSTAGDPTVSGMLGPQSFRQVGVSFDAKF